MTTTDRVDLSADQARRLFRELTVEHMRADDSGATWQFKEGGVLLEFDASERRFRGMFWGPPKMPVGVRA